MKDYQLSDGVLSLCPGTTYVRSQEFCLRDDIETVIIPDGVGFMEDECFTECPNLKTVVLPEGLINIGPAAFADCPKLQSVNIPSTVKSIDSGAFFYCESLKEISFPEGLEQICEYAFQNTGLVHVTVPEGVKEIENCAFFSCESLRRADVLGKSTVIGEDAFGSNYGLIEGYIAPGYPNNADRAAELLYTLLWCSCPSEHDAVTAARAESFIRKNGELIIERILKEDNIPAMTGIADRGLLPAELVSEALRKTLLSGQTELSALLLRAGNSAETVEGEFEL